MRITVVTATPAGTRSGSGTYVAGEALALGLRARGHQVSTVRPAADPERWPGFALRRLAFNAGLSVPATEREADLVVGFDLDGWRIAGRTRRPFVAYLHGVIADEARFERGAVRLSLRLQARAERINARRAHLVLATSEYSRGRIEELYHVPRERLRVVRPGIDPSRWQAAVARPGPAEPGRLTILSVAHMYPRKNLGALLRAAALLRSDFPQLRLRLVGDGPERGRWERLARALHLEPVATFLGHVPFETLAAQYAGCTVFCLPSLQEGFGLAFAEAMAAGKPVVGLRAGATPELVADGVHGRLVAPGDDAALVGALRELLADAPLRARLGAAARAQAWSFTIERMATQFLEAVRPLLPAGPGPRSRPTRGAAPHAGEGESPVAVPIP